MPTILVLNIVRAVLISVVLFCFFFNFFNENTFRSMCVHVYMCAFVALYRFYTLKKKKKKFKHARHAC